MSDTVGEGGVRDGVEMGRLTQQLFDGPLDVIGDIHGEREALETLLEKLGYDPAGRHADGRRLVFVGDFCDRGPDSPGVIVRRETGGREISTSPAKYLIRTGDFRRRIRKIHHRYLQKTVLERPLFPSQILFAFALPEQLTAPDTR